MNSDMGCLAGRFGFHFPSPKMLRFRQKNSHNYLRVRGVDMLWMGHLPDWYKILFFRADRQGRRGPTTTDRVDMRAFLE